MGRQYGTDRSVFNTLSAPLLDPDGLPIVDTGTGFGSSPLGISLREQIQFGLPNATFNLLPPDPAAAISEGENPLPFWELQTTPNITATAEYDTTTQTWGVKVDPGTAPSGDYATLKTRSWVTTDDNLALRQRASLTLAKNGTYAGTSQWNLTLTAEYFDHTNTSLGTTTIGTVYDNTTWTSISGTTTAGGSAIPSSAAWAEFTVKLTASAAVTSSTSATLKSLLLATSAPASAGGAFVVTETFNASGTWTRPTGVTTLLAVVGVGGGGGGMGGRCFGTVTAAGVANQANGGPGGASSSLAIIREVYVGGTADATITVGIGTAGVGGAGTSFTKAAAGTTQYALDATAGGAGGASTFGSYLTIPGGGGGTGYITAGGGTAAGAPTSNVYGMEFLGSVRGTFVADGIAGSASTFAKIPYWETFTSGAAGSAATATGATLNSSGAGGVAGSAGVIGGGAGGGTARFDGTNLGTGAGFIGGYGAGSGGGAATSRIAGTQTVTATAGAGGAGASNAGGGGGGGGGAGVFASTTTTYNASTITATSGAGGNGSAGRIYVIYVA